MQSTTAFLTASVLDDGRIAIIPFCTDPDYSRVSIIICAGETFGGRTFAEWQEIACGIGSVDAAWLDV